MAAGSRGDKVAASESILITSHTPPPTVYLPYKSFSVGDWGYLYVYLPHSHNRSSLPQVLEQVRRVGYSAACAAICVSRERLPIASLHRTHSHDVGVDLIIPGMVSRRHVILRFETSNDFCPHTVCCMGAGCRYMLTARDALPQSARRSCVRARSYQR